MTFTYIFLFLLILSTLTEIYLSIRQNASALKNQNEGAEVEGLIIMSVDPDSNAAEKGLAPGDIVTDAAQKPVRSVADFEAQVDATKEAGRQSLLLLVRRDSQPRFVVLPIDD